MEANPHPLLRLPGRLPRCRTTTRSSSRARPCLINDDATKEISRARDSGCCGLVLLQLHLPLPSVQTEQILLVVVINSGQRITPIRTRGAGEAILRADAERVAAVLLVEDLADCVADRGWRRPGAGPFCGVEEG
jgi:hypothetical protein